MSASPASKEARSKELAGAITATRSPGLRAGGGWNARVVVMCGTLRLWRVERGSSNDRLPVVAAAPGGVLAAGAGGAGAVPAGMAVAAAVPAGRDRSRGGVRAAAGDHPVAGARALRQWRSAPELTSVEIAPRRTAGKSRAFCRRPSE